MKVHCVHCGIKPAVGRYRNLCQACYKYQQRHGRKRPQELIEKPLQVKWCKVCGHPKIHGFGMCEPCYRYRIRHGRKRPRYKWDTESQCLTCGRPLAMIRSTKNRCKLCYDYLNKCGIERPPHLWGIGPHGWCECGWPAVEIIAGMPLCKGCAELERSP